MSLEWTISLASFAIKDAVFKGGCHGVVASDRSVVARPVARRGASVVGLFSAQLDPDKDGTVDLAEAKNAAGKLFDKLDRDKDGTLDARELRGRMSKSEFAPPIRTMTARSTERSISPWWKPGSARQPR